MAPMVLDELVPTSKLFSADAYPETVILLVLSGINRSATILAGSDMTSEAGLVGIVVGASSGWASVPKLA